ncbi:MAG: phosphate transport system regulatory protein PhoU [Gammaproteobacteria bacterium]|nr:MAG: phosphate transport system regulatory protein PhoU [Gammaproteobacteria bacterium]
MDKLHLDQHISRQYNEELEQVRNAVLEMGQLARDQLAGSLAAVLAGDGARGRELDAADDRIDELERSIDDEAQGILARRQPAATDLRLVISVIKTITDFERMGDEAQKMARMAVRRSENGQGIPPQAEGLRELGARVQGMVDDTLTSLAALDAQRALAVCRLDAEIDADYKALIKASLPSLAENPANALDLVWAARALERIGDHACNICEYLIYLLGGEDVRHASLEDVAAAARKARDRHDT